LIRISLTADDYAGLQAADVPNFGYEIALGGAQLADRTSDRKLDGWRLEVARGWNPDHSRLFDLYTRIYIPAFFDQWSPWSGRRP
jgi:hypothetical protein